MADQSTQTTELKLCLHDFQAQFNANPRVRKLVKNWDRQVMVEATDTGVVYTMHIEDQQVRAVDDGPAKTGDNFLVHMQASHATLVDIFGGKYNPSTALLDGMLSVFSNERDKVKLEACALVIWGL